MIEEIKNNHWDIIIFGTGIGGSTLGNVLAKEGKKVLFIEKGRSHLGLPDTALAGDYAEHFAVDEELLRRAGRYSEKISFPGYEAIPFIGCGTGGSSAIYGMLLERFSPVDFINWPITYEELADYYAQAETLYKVKKEGRESFPPPPFCPAAQELFDFFSGKGLHPYHCPMACDYVPGCKECSGFICPKNCKNDSVKICLQPSIDEYSAQLLTECEVLSLAADGHKVTGVKCRKDNEEFTLSGELVVLAAGAIHTPIILLRSGLANGSGMVGKNLMRHFVDLYSVKTRAEVKGGEFTKQVAFNDFYICDNIKLGNVQALGNLPNPQALANDLLITIRRSIPVIGSLLGYIAFPFIKIFAQKNIQNRIIMAGIMEDFPYYGNSVSLADNGTVSVNYKLHKEAKERLAIFRKKIRQALSPYKFTFVANAHNNEQLAHACGTCKAGTNPMTSVVDKYNKAHELDNLYIVDSSFFPSSAGTNPSLTIAANSLRVASHLLEKDKK